MNYEDALDAWIEFGDLPIDPEVPVKDAIMAAFTAGYDAAQPKPAPEKVELPTADYSVVYWDPGDTRGTRTAIRSASFIGDRSTTTMWFFHDPLRTYPRAEVSDNQLIAAIAGRPFGVIHPRNVVAKEFADALEEKVRAEIAATPGWFTYGIPGQIISMARDIAETWATK